MSLTKRLVGRREDRRDRPSADSRARLLAAAAARFAASGFDGTSVDRIAADARVNKAMIYYHFGSKAALYREILRDMFAAVALRARATALSELPPEQKIRDFIEAIALEAEARPHFPPIWFREIADQGRHLDDATVRNMASVVNTLSGIIQEGVEAGRFRAVHPVLLHFSIIGPLIVYLAGGRLRQRLGRGGITGADRLHREDIVSHVQRVTLAMLEGRQP